MIWMNLFFQHDLAYGKYKNSAKRTESDKVVRDKAFKIASNPKYNGYERVLVSYPLYFVRVLVFGENLQAVVLSSCRFNNLQMNFINQLLQNLKDEGFVLHLKTIFLEVVI